MSKIQINELNLTTSEFNQLNDGESGSVVGGGNVNNNQSNNNSTGQFTVFGTNVNYTNQNNYADIYNSSYKGYGYYY
jgi:hypothetical protein